MFYHRLASNAAEDLCLPKTYEVSEWQLDDGQKQEITIEYKSKLHTVG